MAAAVALASITMKALSLIGVALGSFIIALVVLFFACVLFVMPISDWVAHDCQQGVVASAQLCSVGRWFAQWWWLAVFPVCVVLASAATLVVAAVRRHAASDRSPR